MHEESNVLQATQRLACSHILGLLRRRFPIVQQNNQQGFWKSFLAFVLPVVCLVILTLLLQW